MAENYELIDNEENINMNSILKVILPNRIHQILEW